MTTPGISEVRVDGLSDDEQEMVRRLLAQLAEKSSRNYLRASYYDGKRAARQIGTIIPPIYYRLGMVLGWSAKAVDILARRCNIDGIVWPDGNLGSLGASRAWHDYRLGARLASARTSSLLYGVAFLVVTRGGDGEPPALLHVKDARSATGDWDPRLWRLSNLLSVTDRGDDGLPTGMVLYEPNLTTTMRKGPHGWEVDRAPHDMGLPVEPMVYRQREDREFGSSRITRAVMSIHDRALRTTIRMEGHADVYSFPEMWLLGADESLFKNADGSQKAMWQVVLGRIKAIPDDQSNPDNARADVKQFPASSPEPHIAQLKQQAQEFAGETSIPLTSLGVSDMSNPTSADSYIASREDLIAEAEGAADDWTPAVQRTLQRFLATLNGKSGELPEDWSTIGPKWRSPVYLSRAAAADAGSKQLGAVPWLAETSVGLELLGLDEQQIRRAMAERNRAAGRQVLSQLLGRPNQAVAGADVNG